MNIDMNLQLDKIIKTYKDELSNYKYIEPLNIPSLDEDIYICYINNNLILKHGYVVSIRNKNNMNNIIIELKNRNNTRRWFIYTKDMYIFMKDRPKDDFRDLLKSFLDNDFANLTVVTKSNKK
jgi:hypothetical protein